MEIAKKFKSIHIDTEKDIYLLNGKKIESVYFMRLQFEDGLWSLKTTQNNLYESKATLPTREWI